jgi:hypothetical protein
MLVRRSLLSILAIVLLGASALAVSAAAKMPTTTYSTHIVMSEKFPAFHGKLHSKSDFCVANRPVKVYREALSGKDKLLGVKRSEEDGTWKVSIGNKLTSGAYYSEAPAYGSASLGISCKAARSQVATVD